MCGLAGIFGRTFWKPDGDIFRQMLIGASMRGMQSTGIAMANPKDGVAYTKGTECAIDFINTQKFDSFSKKFETNATVMMGHARYATHGNIQHKNAHPFKHEHIVLAHNGGVHNHRILDPNFKSEVDSEFICHLIATHGVEWTVARLQGAFALTWLDETEKTFNIIRNEDRTLALYKNKYRDVYYYTSEAKLAEWVMERNNTKEYERIEFNIGEQLVWSLEHNTLTRIKRPLYTPPSYLPVERYRGGQSRGPRFPWDDYEGYSGYDQQDTEDWKNPVNPRPAVQVSLGHPNVVAVSFNQKKEREERRGTEALRQCDSSVGEYIRVYLYSWNPYVEGSTSRLWGKALGCFMDNGSLDCDIFVNGIRNTQLHALDGKFNDGYYSARISACKYDEDLNKLHLFVTNPEWIVEQEKDVLYSELYQDISLPKEVQSETIEQTQIDVPEEDDEDGMILNTIIGPDNVMISVEEFYELTKYGCARCSTDIDKVDAEDLYWMTGSNPICLTCQETEQSWADKRESLVPCGPPVEHKESGDHAKTLMQHVNNILH